MYKFLLAAVLAAFSIVADAASKAAPNWTVQAGGSSAKADSGTTLGELLAGRTYTPKDNHAVEFQDLMKGPVRGSPDLDVRRVATGDNVARAIVDALPYVGTAIAIAEIANAVRCKITEGGGFGCDPGTPKTEGQMYRVNHPAGAPNPPIEGASLSAVADAYAAALKSLLEGQYVAGTSGTAGQYSARIDWTYTHAVTVLSLSDGASPSFVVKRKVVKTTCQTYASGSINPSQCFAPSDEVNGNQTVSASKITQLSCPASVDASNPANSVPAGLPAGADGLCKTGRYDSKNRQEVADKIRAMSDTARKAEALREALEKGGEVATGPASVTGPATKTGQPQVTTTTGPQGTTRTTTTPKWKYGYTNDTVTVTDEPTVVTENPDGTTTTTTTDNAPPPQDIITCGLPDTPPCKIDETGTPVAGDLSGGNGAIETERGKLVKEIEDSSKRTSLPWSWTWALPSGACTPFTFGTNARPMVVNPCDVSGVHLWRSLLAWMLAIMTGIHIWQSVKELGA